MKGIKMKKNVKGLMSGSNPIRITSMLKPAPGAGFVVSIWRVYHRSMEVVKNL